MPHFEHSTVGPLVVPLLAAGAPRFDVEILRVCSRQPRTGSADLASMRLAHRFWDNLGFAGADISLPDARVLAQVIRTAGGAAVIVPSAYRTPTIPILAARRIAEQRLEVMRLERGGSFGLLSGGEACSMWWRFYVDHSWIANDGAEPDLVCIDIDIVDGHVASTADERQLAEWQQGAPLPWAEAPEPPPML